MAAVDITGDPCEATIKDVIKLLAPSAKDSDLLGWPPDVFGISAYILQKSGAYIEIVRDWPPSKYPLEWAQMITMVGQSWRNAVIAGASPPTEVVGWWSAITKNSGLRIGSVSGYRPLIDSLAQLLGAADEASRGVGIPDAEDKHYDQFDNRASRRLFVTYLKNASTLCCHIDASLFRVLPKLHTPQNGITIRSLSHHLALCSAGEVNPKWIFHPPTRHSDVDFGLNLLLIPWPKSVSPLEFSAVRDPAGLRNMPKEMGFFSYKQNDAVAFPAADLISLVQRAVTQVGRIDGVIFPELALRSELEFDQAYTGLSAVADKAFLIAGVGGKAVGGTSYDINRVHYRAGVALPSLKIDHVQSKHHRWRLDEGQVRQYGLSHRLDPYTNWWENTDLQERQVHFFAVNPWLTFCTLICEDLARQDPIADVLRAVGPNLIIALLMDGPQLQKRWSGRYATVFADDPGSSVLCLTSVGMATLSRPLDQSEQQLPPRRVVGLWKDALGGAREIEIPDDADAVVISLNRAYKREWTADGRSDNGSAGYLTFGGLHHVGAK